MTPNKTTYQNSHSRPKLDKLLKSLSLDKQYVRGSGNLLFRISAAGKTIPVSDYIGGYGSLLLGHHHPELKRLAINLLNDQLPNHAQLSSKSAIEDLGSFISEEIGSYSGKTYVTTLANSGAEVVEAAIKHARLDFSKKKEKLIDRLHRELHSINHHFSINDIPFIVLVENQTFTDFSVFQDYCIASFQEVFDEQSPILLALDQSFHGKTTGALNLTSNAKFRHGFQTNKQEKSRVSFFNQNLDTFEDLISDLSRKIKLPKLQNGSISFEESTVLMCLGVIVEPIQGEGGIRPIPNAFLSFLRDQTAALKIPLIFDEIQCGSYRTGTLAHSLQTEIYADYYLFSKSFGGGMVKNAALVIDRKHYHEGFGVVHTSTYADDEYSSKISLKALQIAKSEIETIRQKGKLIELELLELKKNFPSVIKEVRGTGLMWGIDFFDLDLSENYSFQMFSRSGYLNYLYCSYLLNKWDIRLAPTLSDPHTLRVLPSIFVSEKEIKRFSSALYALSKIIEYRDFYKLIEHLVPSEEQNIRPLKDFGQGQVLVETDAQLTTSVGFISHYINENGVRDGDRSMAVLTDKTINQLLESVIEISVPILLHGRKIS